MPAHTPPARRLLADQGDQDGLRELADAGHSWAAYLLADLLAQGGGSRGMAPRRWLGRSIRPADPTETLHHAALPPTRQRPGQGRGGRRRLANPHCRYHRLTFGGGREATHPPKVKPELMADAPSQVWTWDITKLRGPAKGVWFQLYVIIDIFSRFNPSWIVSPVEDSGLATDFIAEAIERNGVVPHTVHADRGTLMTSKPVSALLTDLGVTTGSPARIPAEGVQRQPVQ